MIHQIENWLQIIFSDLSRKKPADFTGLGLIFYASPLALPAVPLAADVSSLRLPACGPVQSARLLRKISRARSPFHDGFHLVDAHTLCITHVSQFVSPPLPDQTHTIAHRQSIGARFMAAYLGSLLPTVAAAATLSKDSGGNIFINGTVHNLITAEG
jgi:hypothetical protein